MLIWQVTRYLILDYCLGVFITTININFGYYQELVTKEEKQFLMKFYDTYRKDCLTNRKTSPLSYDDLIYNYGKLISVVGAPMAKRLFEEEMGFILKEVT